MFSMHVYFQNYSFSLFSVLLYFCKHFKIAVNITFPYSFLFLFSLYLPMSMFSLCSLCLAMSLFSLCMSLLNVTSHSYPFFCIPQNTSKSILIFLVLILFYPSNFSKHLIEILLHDFIYRVMFTHYYYFFLLFLFKVYKVRIILVVVRKVFKNRS